MKIICNKYSYPSATEINEVNYFSETSEETREELDLYPYLLQGGLSPITSVKTKVDDNNKVYLEVGDVTLNLSNTLTGWGDVYNYKSISETLLTDFFGYYSDNKELFKIQIYDNNNDLYFSGVFRKYDISFPDRSNEQLNVTVRSLEKEFAEYYSGQDMLPVTDITNYYFTDLFYSGLKFLYIDEILKKSFPRVQFDFENDTSHFIHSYIMANKPYIYAPCNVLAPGSGNTLILKTGYEAFKNDGVDVYDYFKSIMLSMGWKWTFAGETLKIERRTDFGLSEYDINYVDIISHSTGNDLVDVIDTVAVDNGQYYGYDNRLVQEQAGAMNIYCQDGSLFYFCYLGGQQKAIYSEGYVYNNYERPFQKLQLSGLLPVRYERIFNNWAFTVQQGNDTTEESLKMRYLFGVNYGWLYQYQILSYDLNRTIQFNPRIPSAEKSAVLNLSYPRTTGGIGGLIFYGNGNAWQETNGTAYNGDWQSIYYRGNAGSGMLKIDSVSNTYTPYDNYIRSDEFNNNMKSLLTGGDTVNLTVSVNGLISDYNRFYTMKDYPYADYSNKKFVYNEVTFDILNNVTTLKLTSVN